VAASAVKAGLRVRVADVDPETLDYAPAALRQIDAERVLAIVATNLYGLPSDMPALTRWAQERGVFLVDDAAQAMGASISGRASGTWGDAGLFSFDRGKNVSAINGGAVLSHCANVATALATEMRTLGSPRLGAATLDVVGALAYTVLLHPVLYGVPARMPFLGLGKTQFDTDYPLERTSRPLAALALTMLDRLPVLTLARRENAARLDLELRSLPGIQLPQPRPGADPAYLRFPLLMPSRESRDESVMRLTARGIGASGSYPRAIVDVRELQDRLVGDPATPMGRTIADRILTLPTHPYVRAADIRSIREHLESVLRRHERAPRRVAPAVFGQTQ